MDASITTFIIPAFIAGVFTFLAPCTLPLVPAYLSFISGVPEENLKNPKTAPAARRKIFLNGLFFILGFSIIFITFGTLAGLVGTSLVPIRVWLARAGGLMVILFGLFMLGLFRNSVLSVERRIKLPAFLTLGKQSSSLFVGGAFALGWSPCVGPILGSILLFASQSGTALQGALLLAIFSAGLALPFLLISMGASKASSYISKFFAVLHKYRASIMFVSGLVIGFLINLALLGVGGALGEFGKPVSRISEALLVRTPWLLAVATAIILAAAAQSKKERFDVISVVGGLFLIPLGVLLLTDNFNVIIQYGYKIFNFINYEGLLDYL